MNSYFLIHEAERSLTTREQREADIRAGELAAEFARLRRALRRGLGRALRRGTAAHTDVALMGDPAVAGDPAVVGDAAVGELDLTGTGDQARRLTSLCN